MVTDSISLITKNLFLTSVLILVGTACSSPSPQPKKVVEAETIGDMLERKLVIDGRPTQQNQHSLFLDRTSDYGLDNIKATQIYAVDFNLDGHQDLVLLPEHYSSPRFFENKKGKFVELKYSPFPKLIRAQAMVFVDLDRDGQKDLITYTLNQRTALNWDPIVVYRGAFAKGKLSYQIWPNAVSLSPDATSSVVPFDFDLDGNLDLYVGNWYDMRSNPPVNRPDRLLKGDGFRFFDNSALLADEHHFKRDIKLFDNARPTMAVSLCDVDQNGRPDILTSSSGGYFNKMWLNLKKGQQWLMQDYSEKVGFAHDPDGVGPLSGGNSFYASCTDYNNDSIMDIAVGELFHSYESEKVDRSAILTGSSLTFPPAFIRNEYINDDGSGRWTQADRRGTFADLNNDGLIDLIIDNSGYSPKTRLVVFRQHPDHSYEDVALDWGVDVMNPSGTIMIDVDGDGDLDLLVGQNSIRDSKIENHLTLFENQTDSKVKSLSIKLHGQRSNRDGIGAKIDVYSGNQIQRRIHQLWSGPLSSQSENKSFFGLGNDNVKKIIVTWPITKSKDDEKNLVVTYDLSRARLKARSVITLCESGQWHRGLAPCSNK